MDTLLNEYNTLRSQIIRNSLLQINIVDRSTLPPQQKINIKTNITNRQNIQINNAIANYRLNMLKQPLPQNNLIVNQTSNPRALFIGCNYPNTVYKLNGCLNDVVDMYNAFRQYYKPQEINILADAEFNPMALPTEMQRRKRLPTRKNIIDNITLLLKSARNNDTLLLTYSGHGVQRRDINGDEVDRQDECLVPCDAIGVGGQQNYISDDELNTLIKLNLKQDTTLIVLMDACHSGTMLDLKCNYSNINMSAQQTANDKVGQVIMISGCMDNQKSADAFIENRARGAMSWAFLETIKSRDKLTWKDLITNMQTLLRPNYPNQIPQLSSNKYIDINTEIIKLNP